MFTIRTTTTDNKQYYSYNFDTMYGATHVAIGYVRHYPEVLQAEIINKTTNTVEKIFVKEK